MFRKICDKFFYLIRNCWKNGIHSRRWLATNGFVGQRWSNKRKLGKNTYNDCRKKSWTERKDLVAGLDVHIEIQKLKHGLSKKLKSAAMNIVENFLFHQLDLSWRKR